MTKIVMTCGPACEDTEIIMRIASIADVFRLNVAHLSPEKLESWLLRLRNIRNNSEKDFSVLLDLQGAKVRIGEYPACDSIPARVQLFLGNKSSDVALIPVPAESIFAATVPGDILFLNDRKVVLKVVRCTDMCIQAEVLQNGSLSSNKGLNSSSRTFELARATDADRDAIAISRDFEQVNYAISFVNDGSEIDIFRPLVNKDALFIAKIEQCRTMNHLSTIATEFDELWFCRGDMGSDAGLIELGALQNEFVKRLVTLPKPALLAGEVLGSMVSQQYPSRAEIVQLYDAIQGGFSGIVLSDETACGNHVSDVLNFLDYYFFNK